MPQRSNRDRTTPQQSNDQPGEHRKSRKESRRFTKPPIPPGTIDDKNVINLSSKTLSINHLTLLNKGLTFCPTPYNNHPCHDLRDILLFNRRVRLTHHFNCETQTISPTSRDHFHRFKQSSGWTPPPGKDPFIDSFTSNLTSNFVNRTSPTHTGSNLTQGELDALNDLKLDTDLVIKSADKGGAIVLQNRHDYLKEGLRQLSNVNHYERSTTTLFDASSKKIKIYLTNLVKANYLPSNAHLNLTYKNPRLPSLYLLPKIHKTGNPGRPIISACGGPTEKISSFVDSILKPFVTALPSHVKDTTHFLNLIHDLHLPTNHTLMTIDVSSLYTNIPHNEGLEACKELLLTRTVEDPPTRFVVTLIRFILTLNYFEFNDTVYHQVSGTAMGTKMAPNYANIFMGHLEKQLLNLHPVKPTLWLRYIDDIFCIYPGNENEANNFLLFLNSHHHSIKFTADISNRSVNFLDVTVLVNDQGKLTTTLYRKPTDTYRYLHFRSFHPKHQKKAIPYSQFVRVRRVCSQKRDFIQNTDNMIQALVTREYPMKLLITARSKAAQIDRSTLLDPPSTPITERNIPLIITFDPNHLTVSTKLSESRFLLENVKPRFNAKVMLTFRRNQNLKNHLVKSKLGQTPKPRGTTPCGKPRCETCPQLIKNHTVRSTSTSRQLRVMASCTCLTTDIVYLIQCYRCGLQYVGQTNNPLHIRFQQHIRDIRLKDLTKPVSIHYNSVNHTPRDARVIALDHAHCLNARLRLEEAWITLLATHQPAGLNQRY